MTTVRDVWTAGVRALREKGLPQPEKDAKLLMADALGCAPYQVSIRGSDAISADAQARFGSRIDDRMTRKPVARILGRRQFFAGEFAVTDAVLDPRPETEVLVELGIQTRAKRILDLGTGSGCILISTLKVLKDATGVGTDISPEAVLIAGENAHRHGVADRAVFPLSDWYNDIGGQFDLIVSNPPYIAASEMAGLAPEVRDFDPHGALTDDADGLTAYRRIAAGALNHLTPGGHLFVEIGPTQAGDVSDLFRAAGLESTAVHPDLDGRDRVVAGTAPKA